MTSSLAETTCNHAHRSEVIFICEMIESLLGGCTVKSPAASSTTISALYPASRTVRTPLLIATLALRLRARALRSDSTSTLTGASTVKPGFLTDTRTAGPPSDI